MSEHLDNLDEQQRLAQDAVRSLPRPEADPEFRARLKDRFVSGAIDQEAPTPSGSRLGSVWLGWSALAAAAVVTFALLGFNRLPGPELAATNGVGSVWVDGREIAADRTGVIDAALRVGTRVQVSDGAELDVVYPGTMVMRLIDGADFILPERPGRWFRRTVEAPLAAGEICLRTGPDLAGGGVILRTDDGLAIVRGTLISVESNEAVTCICLVEGSVDVVTHETDLGPLAAGQRWVLFRDGSEPQGGAIADTHRDHMLALDQDYPGFGDHP
ncbi:MAG: hypothetical protein GY838_20045 [bacterium]|nr:hypothetical protein [bacterium]